MKVSPVSSTGNTVGSVEGVQSAPQPIAQRIRALKMTTNVTPAGRFEEPPPAEAALAGPETVQQGETADGLTTQDVNSDTEQAASEEAQPLSPQFAALAKQRRALQVKERELARKEQEIAERTAQGAGGISKEQLLADPLGVLLGAGVTYEQLTDAVTNRGGMSDEMLALKRQIAEIEGKFTKTLSERDAQAEQQALAQMSKEAQALISDGDQYELVRETGSLPQVMQLIERVYRENGEVLDVAEACQLVEDELYQDSLKLANLKKVQSALKPTQPVAQPAPQNTRQVRTLTNRDNATVPMSARERAIAAFHGTLKR